MVAHLGNPCMPATLLLVAIAIGIPVIIGAVVVGYGMAAYNRLVASRNRVREGWSGIEVTLKRRANLVPNLVETVKSHTAHEKGMLETVLQARQRSLAEAGPTPEHARAEDQLTAALGKLVAVAEADPALRTDAGYRQLQDELAEIERDLEKARRYYNGTVQRLNTQIEQFPSNVVAGMFGFAPADYFEIVDPAKRAVPEVGFGR